MSGTFTPPQPPVGAHGGLVLLLVRGFLLWIVIPVGFVIWLLASLWLMPRGVTLGKFLGWLDNNMTFGLQRTILRPFFSRATGSWIPAAGVSRVTHRVSILDPF